MDMKPQQNVVPYSSTSLQTLANKLGESFSESILDASDLSRPHTMR
jgi:hypothetical protein